MKPAAGRAANQRAEVRNLPRPQQALLVALGPIPRALLAGVAAELEMALGPKAALGAAQQRPAFALNEARRQYHSAAILRRLGAARGAAGPGVPILGVTDVDLFVPDAPFVFGEADRDAHAAVVSTARLLQGPDGLPADPARLLRRVAVEAVHELGHLLGLSHCADSRCAMFLSHKASDTDRKGPGLCHPCRGALGLP